MSKEDTSANKQLRDMEETLKAFQASANAAMEERDAQIAALQAQLAKSPVKAGNNAVPATHDGVNYLIVHAVSYDGKRHTPAEIAANEVLLSLLIENNSSAVQLA